MLGIASLGSRIIGVFRERVLTTQFGAGDTFDAFVAAFRLPDLVFNLVVVGALSAAFIPLFTEKLVKSRGDKAEAFNFSLSVLHTFGLVIAGLCGIYAWLAPQIVPLITPGFSGEKLELTIKLSRIMALQPILLTISFIISGVLNSFKRFMAYAWAPIVYNIGIIIGVYLFVPSMGPAGLGWGVVLGAALHALIQVPSLLRVGFRWRPVLHWSGEEIKKMWRMVLPRMFGLGGQQFNLFLVTIIGSGLAAGSISAFHIASNVQSLPIGLFGLAFAQAAFPTLAEQVARGKMKEFRDTLTRVFRYILFIVVPISVFFFLLRAQIIRVLFGDGAFDWKDTIMTFEVFGALMLSLFAQAAVPLLVRAFYVKQNTVVPVIASLASIAAIVVLALPLAPRYGIQGVAFAFAIAAIVNLIVLLAVLHHNLNGLNDREVLWSLIRIVIASMLAGMVVQLLKYPIAAVVDMHRFWGVAVQMSVAFAGGVGAYLGLCYLFRCDELKVLWQYVPRWTKLAPGATNTELGELTE